jgi:cytochrome c peroxidase
MTAPSPIRSPAQARRRALMMLGTASLALLCAAVVAGDSGPAAAGGWWVANSNRIFAARVSYPDATGIVTVIHIGGDVDTHGNPFFTALGSNGRACVTCHQPEDGMSISVATIKARWEATQGRDPLFAAVDGSNCPSQPQDRPESHSLLLERGLFRIARPWPPRTPEGQAVTPQFSIEVLHDPTGCNLDPLYGLKSPHPMVSVFRRPRPVGNLKYVTGYGFIFEPKNGLPLPIDAQTGLRYSGNILADQRARTLEEQARDALTSHLEDFGALDAQQMRQLTDFESEIYVAQSVDRTGGSLTASGARGGPDTLAAAKPAVLNGRGEPSWSEFDSWLTPPADPTATAAERAFRASVARGVALFRDRTFLISDSAGLNSMNFGNPTRDSCKFCHNMTRTGMDVAPGQVDLGTTNIPFADPAPDLPLFKLTCGTRYPPHPFLGRVVYTHDPGFALTTGKCIDIGKITIQDMRGLAARPPYFSNGSARTLREIIDYYDRRYSIGLTEQDKEDLTNLLSVL